MTPDRKPGGLDQSMRPAVWIILVAVAFIVGGAVAYALGWLP